MSAVEALKAARAAGVELALDGDDLALKAASAPPTVVLDALSQRKAEIVAVLRSAEDGRRRTGRSSSKSLRGSLSLMAGCRARRPRPRPSPAVWSSGSTAIQCGRNLVVAITAAAPTVLTSHCCHSARRRTAMPGFIRAAGQLRWIAPMRAGGNRVGCCPEVGWNSRGAISSNVKLSDQAARSIG